MKNIVYAIAAACTLSLAAPAAFASTCTIGNCEVTGGILDFGNPVAIQSPNTPLGAVDDQGYISLAPNVPAARFFVDVNFDEPIAPDTEVRAGFADLVIEFFQDSISLGSFQVTDSNGVQTLQGFVVALIADGMNIDFRITGNAFRNAGASLPDYVFDVEAIPIPGALPLLLSGLAGLVFAARKKRAA